MSSSPESNASSSDLYSPSERAGEDGSHQLVGVLSTDGGSRRSAEQVYFEQGVFGDTDGLPEGQMNGDPHGFISQDASFPGLHVLSTPNGQAINAPAKRKREDDDEDLHTVQRHLSRSAESDHAQDSSRTVSLDSAQRPMTQPEGSFGNDGSRTKRPRTKTQASPMSNGVDLVQPAGLPMEIWQHIFSFVPPVFLGRLMRVGRAFQGYLTSNSSEEASHRLKNQCAVQPVSADEVWAASRKRFASGLPKPTLGLSELGRMRLLRGRQCQICGDVKNQNFATSFESPLESGPGEKGIRVIWPFGIRSCGPCLHKCSAKVQN